MPSKLASHHDYQFLPINCPHCGIEGKARIGKLDRNFVCKSCKKNFYVDPDGVILGERPPEKQETDHFSAAAMPKAKPSWIEVLWSKLPSSGQMAIGGAVAIAAFAWFIHWLLTPAVVLPESVEERATLVAKCVVDRDYSTIKKLTLPDTSWDAGNWARRVSAKVGGTIIAMRCERTYSDRADGQERTGMVAELALDRGGKKYTEIFTMHWVRTPELVWLLDGTRSLADAPSE